WTRKSHDAYIGRLLFHRLLKNSHHDSPNQQMREGQTRQSNRAEQRKPRERHTRYPGCANGEASMNKTAEVVATMSIAMAALTGTASAQNSPGNTAIDSSLREAIERKDVPGVVALVTDRERVLYQGAFGVADVATGRPLAQDAIFRIASMTKPVTSVAL